jgi:protease-4
MRLCDIAQAHAAGDPAQHVFAATMGKNPVNREYEIMDGCAMIPVEGVIGRKFDNVLNSSGVVSVDILDRLIQEADADSKVSSIMLVMDTPGGTSAGMQEITDTIRNTVKPIGAYADGMCASAGYWIASQCDMVFATQSADVGSVGVYMAILDRSRQMELNGIKVDMIKSGTMKGMGYPGTTLTEAQRAFLQARVDGIGTQFRAVVRDGRKMPISDDVMQGQSFDAGTAHKIGLIDGVQTMSEAMRDLMDYNKKMRK